MNKSKKINTLRYYEIEKLTTSKLTKMLNFFITTSEKIQKKKKDSMVTYSNIISSFDIETSTIQQGLNTRGNPTGFSYMYHWQFCIMDFEKRYLILTGRTWQSFKKLIDILNNLLINTRLVVYVHNLAFEFQFMRRFFNWSEVFSKEVRKPIFVITENIEFRCSYFLSNMSLFKFCENSKNVRFIKNSDTFDYKKIRTTKTILTNSEIFYCLNDVFSLCECILSKLLDFDDTIASIPLTSTGYVRRILKNNISKNYWENRKRFLSSKINTYLYDFLVDMFRGGNSHCNRYYSNAIVNNIMSFDRASSYPSVLLMCKYPIGSFNKIEFKNINQFELYLDKYALMIDIELYNVKIKKHISIPYLATSKCKKIDKQQAIFDNGRILESNYLRLRCNEIDFKIIQKQYNFDYNILECFFGYKDYLSKEILNTIYYFYEQKTKLKDLEGFEYEYSKSKNILNSCFGVFVTNCINDEIIYNNEFSKHILTNNEKIETLEKYFNTKNNFLNYQIGVWCTAYARLELQKIIDFIDDYSLSQHRISDMIYCDTDSIKCRYDDEYIKYFSKYNENIINMNLPYGLKNYALDKNNKKRYIGVYEDESRMKNHIAYSEFISLGSKKYCYRSLNDNTLNITVSGLSKFCVKELNNKIENFKIGKIFYGNEKHSARTVAYYNDDDIHNIIIDNDIIEIASNIAIFDTTYTLGITSEYNFLLKNL